MKIKRLRKRVLKKWEEELNRGKVDAAHLFSNRLGRVIILNSGMNVTVSTNGQTRFCEITKVYFNGDFLTTNQERFTLESIIEIN